MDYLRFEAYRAIQDDVGINPMRIQDMVLERDVTSFYSTFSLLGTSPTHGRTDDAQMPRLPKVFSYRTEMSVPSANLVISGDIWYDTIRKLSRFDFNYGQPRPPYHTMNPVSMIHDFNTGIAYAVNLVQGNCSSGRLTDPYFNLHADINIDLYDAYHILTMRSSQSFFHFETEFKFIGQETLRSMLCDVFEGVGTLVVNGRTVHVKFKQYFMTSHWSQLNESSANTRKGIPVRQIVTSTEKVHLSFFVDVFDFDDTGNFEPSTWDITNCFDNDQQHTFQVTFNGLFNPFLNGREKWFLKQVSRSYAFFAGTSLLQFQNVKLHYDETSVYVTSTFLGQLNPLSRAGSARAYLCGFLGKPSSPSNEGPADQQ
ncbi:hypothetical protein ScPMuIL_005727 [Solemya velum]